MPTVQLWGAAGRSAYTEYISQCLSRADAEHGGWVPFTRGARISRGVRVSQGLLRRGGPEFAQYAQARFANVDPGSVTLRGLVESFFDWLGTRAEALPLGGALLPQLRAICLTLILFIPVPPFLSELRYE